ncbi:hypothetical protein WDW37_12240 [Bdellovibrionota bacterium FG-1]
MCQANRYTSNLECTSNLSCRYQDAYNPAPQPPVYVPGPGPGYPGHHGPAHPPVYVPGPAPQPPGFGGQPVFVCTIATRMGTITGPEAMGQEGAALAARERCREVTGNPAACAGGGVSCRRVR